MKQENKLKIDSLFRDRERLKIIHCMLNQVENRDLISLENNLLITAEKIWNIDSEVDEVLKQDLGLDEVERQLKTFIQLNNLSWECIFQKDHFQIKVGKWEEMHPGIMTKFDLCFEWELFEHEDVDRRDRFSYLVTDTI